MISLFLRQNGSDQASSETRLSLRASSNPRSLEEAHFSMFLHVFLAVPLNFKNEKTWHPRLFSCFWAVSLNFENGVTKRQKWRSVTPPPQKIIFKLVEGPGPRRPQEVVQLPHSCRPAPSRQPARRIAAALAAPAAPASAGSPALRAAGGHGVHGPQPLHVAVLRVEAPRRVRGARKAPTSSTAFTRRSVRSLLCWNLSALSCRTLNSVAGCLSTSSGAPCTSRGAARCRPRPPAQSGRSTARPCARCPGPPRQWRCGPQTASCGARPPRAAPGPAWRTRCPGLSSPRSSRRPPSAPARRAWWRGPPSRRSCRGSTAASRVKTSITTRPYFVFPRVFWLKSMRSACSRSFGPSAADLPSARGRGACACRPTSAFTASKAMACVTSRSRCLAGPAR